jgi:hypothetical protein
MRRRTAGPLARGGTAVAAAATFGTLLTALMLATSAAPLASAGGGSATISTPARVSGFGGNGDARDADMFPSIAYDTVSQTGLVVWTNAKNASGSSSGLDAYAQRLNAQGQPTGSPQQLSSTSTVARNAPAQVAAGSGEFAVTWTGRASPCRVMVQRVAGGAAGTPIVLSASGHSPSIAYNQIQRVYAVAFVDGDDYLPPASNGAVTADCGNNSASTSRIRVIEFTFQGSTVNVVAQATVSDGSGAFRPAIGFSSALNRYVVAWEDRRNAGTRPYRFDVYSQALSSGLSRVGSNTALATGGDYTNLDTSATWTPRPSVTGGATNLLAAWFERSAGGSAVIWQVKSTLVSATGSSSAAFSVAGTTLAEPHAGDAPSGYVRSGWNSSANEYDVVLTTHMELGEAYQSVARLQRVDPAGVLINLDGTLKTAYDAGDFLDFDTSDQIGVAIAPLSGGANQIVYSKPAPGKTSQDFDVYGLSMRVLAVPATVTPTATPRHPVRLPAVMRNVSA